MRNNNMNHNRTDEFVKKPIKALFILAVPIIISMTAQTLYNVVDTAFVGRLGADAIAALSFSFPVFFILIALNAGLSVGMGSRISRFLGEKNKQGAENTAIHGLLMSFIVAIVIFTIGILNVKNILLLFGASGNALNLSIQYLTIILTAAFVMVPAFMLNHILSAQGDTKTPMKIQLAALGLNIVLDPIFIYIFGWGVRGAAFATFTAFTVSLILAIYFIRKVSYLRLKPEFFRYSKRIIKEIVYVGTPATLMMLLIALYIIFINKLMAFFGTRYVAAFGIASKVQNMATLPILAVALAMIPLVGMFYGAKRYDLIKKVSFYAITGSFAAIAFFAAVFFFIAKYLARIFTNDYGLIGITAPYIRLDVFAFPLIAIAMMISRIMQGMGKGSPGLIINGLRILILGVPLAYVFVYYFNYGYLSIAVARIIGGVVSAVVAVAWLVLKIRKLEMK